MKIKGKLINVHNLGVVDSEGKLIYFIPSPGYAALKNWFQYHFKELT
jgi:hypothetical protein